MRNTRSIAIAIAGLALGLTAGACGDNARARPDAAPPTDASPGPPRAVVVAGDFTEGHPGILSTLDVATREVHTNVGPAMAIGNDPVLRHQGDELLVVNRFNGNNVTILDDQTLALKEQLGTGPGSNPNDIAASGEKLYVATFNGKGLVVLTRGSTAIQTIDLSADDPDHEPNCVSLYLIDTRLYVACELLDASFHAQGPGKIYVVDTATDTLRGDLTVTLVHSNPVGYLERIPAGAPHGGDLVISTVGDFPYIPVNGCLERIATGPTPSAAGCLLDNTAISGYPSRVEFESGDGVDMIWTAVSVQHDPDPLGQLRGYDLRLSSLWADPISAASQQITDVAHCPSGEVVAVDATPNANGLRVFLNAIEVTTAPIPIGLGSFSTHGLVCY
jgi:hypothetical protein